MIENMLLLRRCVGVVFVLAGVLKLTHVATFASLLAQCRVPMPAAFAVAVPLLEIVGGAALFQKRWARLAAGLLAMDMVFAIALVGLRSERLRFDDFTVGGEAWRLPLELGLLASLIVIATRDAD